MSWLTDDEQRELLDGTSEHLQRIPKDIVQQVRDMIDQKVSTGKIAAKVMARVHEELAHKHAWYDNKIDEHDHIITGLAKSFSHVTGFLSKVTGKK